MHRDPPESVVIDLEAFMSDPWSHGGVTVVDDLTRAGHFGSVVHLIGHGVPAELEHAIHTRSADPLPDEVTAASSQAWAERLTVIGRWVLRALALGLGQPIERFEPAVHDDIERTVVHLHHTGPHGLLRRAGGDHGHQDADLLTLVHHDHRGLLEVHRGAHWAPVESHAGAYVVLFGQALERISSGYLRATTYRVRELVPGHGHHVAACRLDLRPDHRLEALTLPPPLDRRAADRHPTIDDQA